MARVVVTQDDRIAKAIADVFSYIDLEPLVRDRVVAVNQMTLGLQRGTKLVRTPALAGEAREGVF